MDTAKRPSSRCSASGGGGGNAVAHMVQAGIEGVDFICANTDAQALKRRQGEDRPADRLQHHEGARAPAPNPEVGRQAAMEDRDRIHRGHRRRRHAASSPRVWAAAPGTGAAPVVAQLAKEMGILTGRRRHEAVPHGRRRSACGIAEQGIAELGRFVDSLITIPNEKLLSVLGPTTTLLDAFKVGERSAARSGARHRRADHAARV